MTRASGRPTPLQVVLVVLLCTTVLWVIVLRQHRSQPDRPETLGPGMTFGPIARFIFSGPMDSIVVERNGEEYWIVHPLRDRADPFFMGELQREIGTLRARRVLPDTSGRAFSLEPPRRRLRVVNDRREVWGIALGDTSPVASEIYARLLPPKTPIVLLELFPARKYLAPELSAVRDPVAVPLPAGPVDSITVLVQGRELRAVRQTRERWVAREPAGLELDPARINQVIQALRSPSIAGFPEDRATPAERGLNPPVARWVLFHGPLAETLRVGRLTENQEQVNIVPAGRTEPAWLGSEFYRGLVGGWPAMADLHLVGMTAESVRVVQFLDPPAAGSYSKEEGRWVRGPSRDPVKRWEALEQEIRNLTMLQWVRYPMSEGAPPRGPKPLRLRLAGDARAETLSLVAGRDSLSWARSTRQQRWGLIPSSTCHIWRYRADHPE